MMTRHWIQRLPLSLSFVGLLVTSQLAIASSDAGTLTAGQNTTVCFPPFSGSFTAVGFSSGGFGSYSPTGLTGGDTVAWIWDLNNAGSCAANHLNFAVTGFSSDPGSSWLTSVTCNGITNLQSNATTYSFSSATGTAFWTFSTRFGLTNGSHYSCTIVHN